MLKIGRPIYDGKNGKSISYGTVMQRGIAIKGPITSMQYIIAIAPGILPTLLKNLLY